MGGHLETRTGVRGAKGGSCEAMWSGVLGKAASESMGGEGGPWRTHGALGAAASGESQRKGKWSKDPSWDLDHVRAEWNPGVGGVWRHHGGDGKRSGFGCAGRNSAGLDAGFVLSS